MTMERVTTKKLALYSGRTHRSLAEEIADHLDVELGDANLVELRAARCGPASPRASAAPDVFIGHYGCDGRSVNDAIMEQLIMIDAAYRASAAFRRCAPSTATPPDRKASDASPSPPPRRQHAESRRGQADDLRRPALWPDQGFFDGLSTT
jgi:hypothetical protein